MMRGPRLQMGVASRLLLDARYRHGGPELTIGDYSCSTSQNHTQFQWHRRWLLQS